MLLTSWNEIGKIHHVNALILSEFKYWNTQTLESVLRRRFNRIRFIPFWFLICRAQISLIHSPQCLLRTRSQFQLLSPFFPTSLYVHIRCNAIVNSRESLFLYVSSTLFFIITHWIMTWSNNHSFRKRSE